MRLPVRDYKEIQSSIIIAIKETTEAKCDYIPDRLLPPVGISKHEIEEFDDLTDPEYVKTILSINTEKLNALMCSEKERRRTFRSTWTYENTVKGIELAQAGFYSLNTEDEVKCAFCSGILKGWRSGDKPIERHRRYYSFCRFIQGKSHKNIPFDDIGMFDLFEKTRTWTDHDKRDEMDPRKMNQVAFLNVDPAKPEYKEYSKRSESYQQGWPAELQPLIPKLCEAGFFNSHTQEPYIDSSECYFCGGTMEDWSGNEDPWAEHAKWFYKCPFLIQSKGHEYIESIRRKMSEQDKFESDNMLYNISSFDQRNQEEISWKRKKITRMMVYKWVYNMMEKSEEIIMQAYEDNDWKDFEDPIDLLIRIHNIEDGQINPDNMEGDGQLNQGQPANNDEMFEKDLFDAMIEGDELSTEQKEYRAKMEGVTCKHCEKLPGVVFSCGCYALCNTCCILSPPQNCPNCYQPVQYTKLCLIEYLKPSIQG